MSLVNWQQIGSGTNKAIIELGTNQIRVIVFAPGESPEILFEMNTMHRIWDDLASKNLDPTKELLHSAKKNIDANNVGSVCFIATAGLRDAPDAETFLILAKEYDFSPQIISGDLEAELMTKAIKYFVPNLEQNCVLIDQGGGSVEFVHCTLAGDDRHSFKIGSVKLTKDFVANPANVSVESELDAVYGHVISTLENHMTSAREGSPVQLIISSGIAPTLIQLREGYAESSDGRIHGQSLQKKEVQEMLALYKVMTSSERVEKYSMNPKKADVMVVAIVAIVAIMDFFKMDMITVSMKELRHGLMIS